MSYTGTEVFKKAVTIIDELSDSGTVVDSQVKDYKNKAADLIDNWQHKLQDAENIETLTKFTDLTQTLQVSDKGCIGCAYYLAYHFAKSDQNDEVASMCETEYKDFMKKCKKAIASTVIIDDYPTYTVVDATTLTEE
jgi:hypothetical protein